MADLVRRSPDDPVARRLLLAALRPGLRRLTRRASAFWDFEEAESIVIAAAVERLADRQITLPARVAAGVLGSVWTTVWNRRTRERWEEAYWGGRTEVEALDDVESVTALDAERELAHLLDEAVRRGAVPAKGARLVLLHWVHGYTNAEIAELDGLRPCTIRKHRRDAELRLAEFAA
jgi:DNA-directed RNA polymerase specialized sigma24 family protein